MTVSPIKRRRLELGLTQKDLAKMAGVFRESVARWEGGSRKVDDDLVPVVARALGLSPSEVRPDLAKFVEVRR